jgi:hypothetical protein
MRAKTVLDPAGALAGEPGLQADASPRPGVRYDVAIGGDPSAADAVLIAGDDLAAGVEAAGGAGFAPDTALSRRGAVLMRRGAVPWPAEALRYFVQSLEWRSASLELEAERKLNGALQGIQAQLSRDADDLRAAIQSGAGGVDESRLLAMEESLRADINARFEDLKRGGREESDIRAHLARLDRKMLEVNRGIQALSGRIDGIFASRTWKALTAAGGALLRVTGRKP